MQARLYLTFALLFTGCPADAPVIPASDAAFTDTAKDAIADGSADAGANDTGGDLAGEATADTGPYPEVVGDAPIPDTPIPDTPIAEVAPDTTPDAIPDVPAGPSCVTTITGLVVEPALETASFVLDSADDTGNDTGSARIRPSGGTWLPVHTPSRLPDASAAGVVFHLTAATTYELEVTVSAGTACATFTTLPETPAHTTSATVNVGPGQSIAAAVSAATPGTDIIVQPGVYREQIPVTVSGAPGQFIRLLGQPGAILDGSSDQTPVWTDQGAGIWTTPWTGEPSYISRDGVRMYHYTAMAGLQQGLGDDDVPIAEGWFAENGTLTVRVSADPGTSAWQLPVHVGALLLDGAAHIWIEGFEIRHYGESEYPKGIDVRGSDNVVIANNVIHDTSSPIWVRKGANHVRIENNTIYQSGVDAWPWAAKKGTDHENSAINIGGGVGFVVAGNTIHTIFNGIATGSFGDDENPDIAHSVDVYRNRMRRIGDDGLEPEGACVNNRFWDNSVDEVHNGVSLAPITWGPVFVVRNRFTDYTQSGFKVSNDSSGPVFLYHNTCFTDRPDNNGMNVSGPFANMTFRNNIVRGTRYALEVTFTLPAGNDLDYDNWFTTRGAPWVKWDNVKYDDLTDWCSAASQECNGHQTAPGLLDPVAFAFGLDSGSTNIDAGILVEGINDDYTGTAPDIGYREFGSAEPAPVP